MSLLVLGTVAFDTIETSFGRAERILGGAATYTCITSSYFTQANILSIVGFDFATQHFQLLKAHNINLVGLNIHEKEKTFFWSGKYHKNMNVRDTIETELNVLLKFNPIIPNQLINSEFVMLGNVIPSIQLKVFNQLKNKPKLIAMDTMNLWIENAYKDLLKIIRKVDLLMINDQEIKELHREESLDLAIEKTFEMGPSFIIVKMGSEGAMLISKNKERFICPAVKLKNVIDPTGAGDSFAGGFMGYISSIPSFSFSDMKTAMCWGTVMASYCVENFGIENITQLRKEVYTKRFNELIKTIPH